MVSDTAEVFAGSFTQQEPIPEDAIDAAVKALAEATEGFAAERMNRSIARALTGRNVSAL